MSTPDTLFSRDYKQSWNGIMLDESPSRCRPFHDDMISSKEFVVDSARKRYPIVTEGLERLAQSEELFQPILGAHQALMGEPKHLQNLQGTLRYSVYHRMIQARGSSLKNLVKASYTEQCCLTGLVSADDISFGPGVSRESIQRIAMELQSLCEHEVALCWASQAGDGFTSFQNTALSTDTAARTDLPLTASGGAHLQDISITEQSFHAFKSLFQCVVDTLDSQRPSDVILPLKSDDAPSSSLQVEAQKADIETGMQAVAGISLISHWANAERATRSSVWKKFKIGKLTPSTQIQIPQSESELRALHQIMRQRVEGHRQVERPFMWSTPTT